MKQTSITIGVLMFIFAACSNGRQAYEDPPVIPAESISEPFTRYWWFASEISKEDIRYNLDWLKANGFGGVEIAWVYPLNRMDERLDTAYTPRQAWLSPEWQEVVAYAISYADSIGLVCDLTMGTLWPFGDSYVTHEQASQTFGREERQKIRASWEYPVEGYVVCHLTPAHYMGYFNRILDSFPQPPVVHAQSYFIDSWEVHTRALWADGLGDIFMERYGYDITPFMPVIYEEGNEHHLYDYMSLISEKVIGFFEAYTGVLNDHGIFSRAQCAGAPADILSAYARVDIPEGEAMLYEPEYNQIPASAATLSGKKVVAAETFTCLYGWPRDYLREEQTADLKLVADALFANGVNHIIWHGKPHNPKGHDTVSFYASVHVGPDGMLASEIPSFNRYLTRVSEMMKRGKAYTDVAVYLPTEDAWINGILPIEQQMRWLWGHYEMRYVYFPDELAGYHPTWINREFLEKAVWDNGILHVGDASFSSLYVDVNHLDHRAMRRITWLARQGLPVTLKNIPAQAGTSRYEEWDALVDELLALPNVTDTFMAVRPALIGTGEPMRPAAATDLPPYRARIDGEKLYLFFAHPKAYRLKFPMDYGQSFTEQTYHVDVKVSHAGNTHELPLVFEPYQSLAFIIDEESARPVDIGFVPKTPQVKARPADFIPPWLPD